MLYVSVQYYITDEVKMYDSLHLHTVYSATDKILGAQFFHTMCIAWALPTVFVFFAKLVLAKDLRLCKKQ